MLRRSLLGLLILFAMVLLAACQTAQAVSTLPATPTAPASATAPAATPTLAPAAPTATATPTTEALGSINGWVWHDACSVSGQPIGPGKQTAGCAQEGDHYRANGIKESTKPSSAV
jgi:hypothetical protein